MRIVEHIGAVSIFLVHCVVGVIIFFGWLWPSIWPIYIGLLVYVLFQNLILGYCILSRWEFSLRRMLNPKLRYQYNFTTYYTYKLTHKRLSTKFVQVAGTFFIVASLTISLSAKFLPSII
ncbi:MAG: hypothetical protein G01um10148_767 [Parcubacteria group bacterium Gr01-1014_8]|nr:MAG: hypothetical protein G01um10148_767 [Parcubacteria group bacterium Gr01-1014_8]